MAKDFPKYGIARIDCSANPMDLRPAVNEIMNAANWLLERLPADKPLVILAGEEHDRPTHASLKLALLRRFLTEKFSICVGLECDYNLPEVREKQALVAAYAPLSHGLFQEAAYISSVPVSANDLPKNPNEILKPEDPFTKSILSRIVDENGNKVGKIVVEQYSHVLHARADFGVFLRNVGIATKVTQEIKKHKPKIYIQECGSGHIIPYDPNNEQESLASLLSEKFAVLNVCPKLSTDTRDFSSFSGTGLIEINGLNEDGFEADETANDISEEEVSFWTRMNRQSNGLLAHIPG